MSVFGVYFWLHLVPILPLFFGVLSGLAFTFAIIRAICLEEWKAGCNWLIVATVVLFALAVLPPSRKTVVMCYVIPAIANSEIMEDLPEDLHYIYSEGMDRLVELVEVDRSK